MDSEFIQIKVDVKFMKVIGKKEKEKVLEFIIVKMGLLMKENGKKI